jgi:FkbM family methyltransferase
MSNDKLFLIAQQAGLAIHKVAEIGVLSIATSSIKAFIENGVPADLYEAVPAFCGEISEGLNKFKNATLHCTAVADYEGDMTLCLAGPSTFNARLISTPALAHDKYDISSATTITVPCIDFRNADPGDYDLVSIDVEGGEYLVLSRMKSRPQVISLETQCRDYRNPYLAEIAKWMRDNGYRVWVWNDTDTIFYKGNPPWLGVIESIKSRWHNHRYFAGTL